MPRKTDDSRQLIIPYPRPSEIQMLEGMDKLQTEISDIKQLIGSIHANLKVLTVAIQTLQIAIEHLSEQNH